MENIEQVTQPGQVTAFNNQIRHDLLETAKWGRFLAIVGYVGMGLLALMAIFMIAGSSFFKEMTDMPFPVAGFGAIYLVLILVYYFPVRYLHKFSNRIKTGILTGSEFDVTDAFRNLKALFQFMGIVTLVILAIYALSLILIIPAALMLKP